MTTFEFCNDLVDFTHDNCIISNNMYDSTLDFNPDSFYFDQNQIPFDDINFENFNIQTSYLDQEDDLLDQTSRDYSDTCANSISPEGHISSNASNSSETRLSPASLITFSPPEVIQITKEQSIVILEKIKAAFSNVPHFDKHLPIIIQILNNPFPDFNEFKRHTTPSDIMTKLCPELAKENPLYKIVRVAIFATYTLFLESLPSFHHQFCLTKDEFLFEYVEFQEVHPEEMYLLLKNCNFVRLALILIRPSQNKELILNIGSRLEGKEKL